MLNRQALFWLICLKSPADDWLLLQMLFLSPDSCYLTVSCLRINEQLHTQPTYSGSLPELVRKPRESSFITWGVIWKQRMEAPHMWPNLLLFSLIRPNEQPRLSQTHLTATGQKNMGIFMWNKSIKKKLIILLWPAGKRLESSGLQPITCQEISFQPPLNSFI